MEKQIAWNRGYFNVSTATKTREFKTWQRERELASGWRTALACANSLLSSDVLIRQYERQKQSFHVFWKLVKTQPVQANNKWCGVLLFIAEYGFNILLTNGMWIIFSFRIAWSYASWKMLFFWSLHYNRTQCMCMETYSVIFLALIRHGDSIYSITGKNYQKLAIIWKLRNKNNCDRSSRKQEKFLENNL